MNDSERSVPAGATGARMWQRQGRCPATEALQTISDKWKASIIAILADAQGPVRFSNLQRELQPVSRKALAEALGDLQADGIVDRQAFAEVPPRVEYSLTERGRAFVPILRDLHALQSASIDDEDRLAR